MKSSPLTGITESAFDHVRVRNPKYEGPMTDIHTLVSDAAYDDTELAAAVSTNTSNIALKRNIADSYTKGEVNALIPGATHQATTLEFDAYGSSANVLTIKGGSMGVGIEDSAGNALADLDQSFVIITPPAQCQNTLLVSGQLTANNISSTTITTALALKSDVATTYTKTQVDSALAVGLAGKQPLIGSGDLSISDTANLQNFINDKQDKVANVSDTEIGYLNGVTGGIQGQITSLSGILTSSINTLDGLIIDLDNDKADLTEVYTQAQANNLLNDRALASNVYTQAQIKK